ncbi:hypothetical protein CHINAEXTREME_16835 [Halobiforma lacisalsi AJ5]|uniref:PGF-pre-PGF domain-containing protein n=1 Tax=Natronobacterium lacisalsi AJ5 TaxID=358396 RepID=M0LS21_NATLA|nr:hypothetical protein [Halobiforma lacisalsi]APW99336.1 hypothetical protein CHINAEXTREME_16835 [Halobiforma lacisalsi AJ5]EMA35234.1 hypothetical protein C445_05928 [Halobiforma lacisalsi AJ5]
MTRSNPATVVAVVALVVFGTVGATGIATAQSGSGAGAGGAVIGTGASAQLSADSYVVEQGDACRQIEPLSTAESVESFYDYRNHDTHPEGVDRMYSSYGTEHLQENNASLLFLHEGTDGISLVMVHDRVDGNTTGGVATFDIVGLPHESEWVVKNDDYDGPTNMDEFDRGDGWASASWIWIESRTAGGAIQGGLNEPFAATIHPAFNEDAEYYDNDDLSVPDWYDGGEIEEWHVLSGDADDPERAAFSSLEEPVTIRTGTCDDPSVSYDRTDDGIGATIDGASPDDVVRLQPTNGTGDAVRFDHVDVTGLEGEETVTFESREPDDLPASPADRESLGSLDGSASGNVTATVTVSVRADVLEERGLDPDRVALYEADGDDGWSEADTSLTDETGTAYYYTAEVSSLEALTVAETGEAPATDGGYASAIPGFELGAAAGVIALLTVALAVRYRSRSGSE